MSRYIVHRPPSTKYQVTFPPRLHYPCWHVGHTLITTVFDRKFKNQDIGIIHIYYLFLLALRSQVNQAAVEEAFPVSTPSDRAPLTRSPKLPKPVLINKVRCRGGFLASKLKSKHSRGSWRCIARWNRCSRSGCKGHCRCSCSRRGSPCKVPDFPTPSVSALSCWPNLHTTQIMIRNDGYSRSSKQEW